MKAIITLTAVALFLSGCNEKNDKRTEWREKIKEAPVATWRYPAVVDGMSLIHCLRPVEGSRWRCRDSAGRFVFPQIIWGDNHD